MQKQVEPEETKGLSLLAGDRMGILQPRTMERPLGAERNPGESPDPGDFSLVTSVREQVGLFLSPAGQED